MDEGQQLLLWRWSTLVQVSSLAMVAAFFALLARTNRRPELKWWARAWAFNLALAEAGAYVIQVMRPMTGPFADLVSLSGPFVSASSSFDTGAEWLIVLGSVLAVSERGRRQLEDANRDLVSAQENLRRLADRDALTGTINRRALREIFNDVQSTGAMLLFFDLDGFKKINDVHGHAAGVSCGFSVGISQLAPGGSPETALQIADQNMYKAKNRERA